MGSSLAIALKDVVDGTVYDSPEHEEPGVQEDPLSVVLQVLVVRLDVAVVVEVGLLHGENPVSRAAVMRPASVMQKASPMHKR